MERHEDGSRRKKTGGRKAVSCAECRRLKIKCDLAFPCRHCVKANLAHLCPSGQVVNGARSARTQLSLEELRERIAHLEFALKETSPGHPLLQSAIYLGPPSDLTHAEYSEHAGPSTMSHSSGRLIVGDSPEVSRYYGLASSVYLSKISLPLPTELPRIASAHLEGAFDIFDLARIMQELPDEQTGRRLSHIYFRTIAWWTNVVPYFSWEERVFGIVYGSACPNAQKLALLLLVLALGVLMDLERPFRDPLANKYFEAANKCLAADASHSTTYVQCIYLIGVYLMNGGSDNVGGDNFWPLLRTGCAIAEAVGLHRDGTHWDLDDLTVRERRCVFWSIHAFDVVQSIALGRGQSIASNRIDCEIPSTAEGDETGFFYFKNVFMGVISNVNELLVRVRPATFKEVIRLDSTISSFETTLPLGLSRSEPPTMSELTDPTQHLAAYHRTFMMLYINETRLALHRPYFIRALREYPQEPIESPFKQSFFGCLEASRAVISLVSNMITIHGPLIERRWHFFFHLVSACVCLASIGIRAPSCMLARSVISELDRGVALFKAHNRREGDTISRLRDQAVDALRRGQGTEGFMEDLDLLGARTTVQSASSPVPPLLLQTEGISGTSMEWNVFDHLGGGFDLEGFLRDIGFVTN